MIPAVHTVLAGWVPPTERARAVSLTTSGMYLGSAAAMLALPSLATTLGPSRLLRLVGGLGLAWLALWRLTLRSVRRRTAAAAMPLHGAGGSAGDLDAAGKRHVHKGRPAATPWRAMLTHPAGKQGPLWPALVLLVPGAGARGRHPMLMQARRRPAAHLTAPAPLPHPTPLQCWPSSCATTASTTLSTWS